jgi:hypothetical protein
VRHCLKIGAHYLPCPTVGSAGLRPLRAVRSRNVEASLPARFQNTKLGGINKQDSHKERGTLRAQVNEYQHSVFDNNKKYLVTNMECQSGQYIIPDAPGLGVEPSDLFWEVATLVAN